MLFTQVGDKLVVLGKNARTPREVLTSPAACSVQPTATPPAGTETKTPSLLGLSLHEDERSAAVGSSHTQTAGTLLFH